MIKKHFFTIAIIAIVLGLCSCSSGSSTEISDEVLEQPEDVVTHSVAVFSSDDAINPKLIEDGFTDVLKEYYDDRITILDDNTQNADVIFCIGEKALANALHVTSETPIVFSEVMDASKVLGESYESPEEKITGINVTGLEATPDIASQLSVIMEITKNLNQVGLFYSPEDAVAKAQNKIMETYLDEAGIAWKEYILPSDKYKKALSKATPKKKKSKLPKPKKIIKMACSECSALYIPSHSSVSDYSKAISNTAVRSKTTTFGGDMISAKHTLASLHVSESSVGFACAKIVVDILTNGRDVSTTEIGNISSLSSKKVYNKDIAKLYGIDFPKSFTEVHSPDINSDNPL
ncbi:MAG: hypothetical protein K6F00_03100 [Lachnospiraceae bacterium]|nr:hypothetical protein [Lachnospiraceae bacterium]